MANEEKWSDSQHTFIRSIQTNPNPLLLVLGTTTQFQNLKAYCTSELVSSVLTVDPTFNIGKYSVTPVTYQDLLLVSKRTGEHPICIGPILISQNLTKDVYADFVYCLQKNCPGLKDELRAFGTDGEKPLQKSFSEGFPSAIKLRCMSHFRNNIKEHLKVLDESCRSKITNQIFGYHSGDGIYNEGMVDADSPEMFDTLYESVRQDWEKKCPTFVRWFDTQTSMIKQEMLANIRTSAGLGYPPKRFYTHNSESANHIIKQKENFKEVSLPQFVHDMKQLRADYDDEFVKAITGRGEYSMKYNHLAVSTDQWFKMSVKQRESYVRKVRAMTMADVLRGEKSTIVNVSSSEPLSVSWTVLQSRLDDVVLRNIWEKAGKIVTSPGAIQPAPFFPNKQTADDTFLVVSESSCENFHTVKCNGSGSSVVKCSCSGFKSLAICSHALAVSEKEGLLTKYVDAFNSETSLNITSINMAGKQDPNVGRKKSNPRKRFKGPMPSTETVVSCQNVFGVTTSKQPHLSAQQHDVRNVQFSTSNEQTPAASRSGVSCGGTLVQPEASVPLARSDCDASRHIQPGSGGFDSAFSFLAEFLNDDPSSITLAGPAYPGHVNRGLQDCTFPANVSASSSLVAPIRANCTVSTSWGSKTATPSSIVPMTPSWGSQSATPLPNVPMTAPWGSKSATPSQNVPMTASWGYQSATPVPNVPVTASCGSKSATASRNVPMMASRGPKPAMPPANEPYKVGTIWGNVRKCYGCKREFLPAVPPDDQYVLVRAESDWYWDKPSMKWRLGRKSNRYYHMLPQCLLINFPNVVSPLISIPAEIPQPVKAVLQHRFQLLI